jgi:hypothetical protein
VVLADLEDFPSLFDLSSSMKQTTANHIGHECEPETEKATVVQAETTLEIATQSTAEDGSTRISSHTILVVLAVNIIYVAQLINIVGAGAVTWPSQPLEQEENIIF